MTDISGLEGVVPKSKLAMVGTVAGAVAVAAVVTYGCVTSRSKIDTPIVCKNFQPIEWVDSDTELTKEQILEHNGVWDKYCNKEKYRQDSENQQGVSGDGTSS